MFVATPGCRAVVCRCREAHAKEDCKRDWEYWINVERTKTGSPSSVPILPKAFKIIEKYQDDPRLINRDRLLPVVSNQGIDAYRKELASLTGLENKLISLRSTQPGILSPRR